MLQPPRHFYSGLSLSFTHLLLCLMTSIMLLSSCSSNEFGSYICTFPDDSTADCAVQPIYLSWSEAIDDEPLYLSAENATSETQALIYQGYPVKEFDGFINTGKIYISGDMLLVNDRFNGVYLFDNISPESPKYLFFFKVLGATDMAISNGIVYINNFTDLLAFELANPSNWSRTKDVLDYRVDGNLLPIDVRFADVEISIADQTRTETAIDIDKTQGVIIGYINSNGKKFYFSDSAL